MLALLKKQTTMKKILLFALMTFFVQTSFCQSLSDTVNVEYSKNSPKRFSFGLGVPAYFGFWWIYAPNLRTFLNDKDIPVSDRFIPLPLSFSYQVNKYKISIEGLYGFPRRSASNDKYNTSLTAESIGLTFGNAILSDRNYFVYLNVGGGYAEYTRTIDIKNQPTTTLASALQFGNGQSIILKNTGAFLDFNLEYMYRASRVGRSIRAGYRFGLNNNAWTSDFIKLNDSPSDKVDSFYIQFMFTFPGRELKKKSASSINNN
jgi:hypothetical protein